VVALPARLASTETSGQRPDSATHWDLHEGRPGARRRARQLPVPAQPRRLRAVFRRAERIVAAARRGGGRAGDAGATRSGGAGPPPWPGA